MKPTCQLHNLGQRLWLDNISRELLVNGTLSRYINELSVTGLTSNPTIFERAIAHSDCYNNAVEAMALAGKSGEALLFELVLEDLMQAADLLRPIHDASNGDDGWVSLEVSPLLADDSAGTVEAAVALHSRMRRPNLFIKIPGTGAGIAAIEKAVFAGVPVNATLLFSREQYVAAANAYMNGIERRIAAGLNPVVRSVASLFVSRWDVAVEHRVAPEMRNRLGIAVAMRTYRAYRELLDSPRWRELCHAGAKPQRLLWASTGTKDPRAAETLYVEALAAADTINTLPEKTLLAFANYGRVTTRLAADGGGAETLIAGFTGSGIDLEQLAEELQRQGIAAFSRSWNALLVSLASKLEMLRESRRNTG